MRIENFSMAFPLSLVVVALGACGGDDTSGGGTSGASGAGSQPDIAGYQSDLAQVQSAVTAYRGKMGSSSVTDTASCHLAASQYDGQVRPMVSNLVSGAGPMDESSASASKRTTRRVASWTMECGVAGEISSVTRACGPGSS